MKLIKDAVLARTVACIALVVTAGARIFFAHRELVKA